MLIYVKHLLAYYLSSKMLYTLYVFSSQDLKYIQIKSSSERMLLSFTRYYAECKRKMLCIILVSPYSFEGSLMKTLGVNLDCSFFWLVSDCSKLYKPIFLFTYSDKKNRVSCFLAIRSSGINTLLGFEMIFSASVLDSKWDMWWIFLYYHYSILIVPCESLGCIPL